MIRAGSPPIAEKLVENEMEYFYNIMVLIINLNWMSSF